MSKSMVVVGISFRIGCRAGRFSFRIWQPKTSSKRRHRNRKPENPRGQGWDALLRMVSDREARQHYALQGANILVFIERLATLGRATPDGLGSFSDDDLSRVFQETCGFPPDDAARTLISRLPALGSLAPESGRRRFIDTDFADAARAGDVLRLVKSPYDPIVTLAFRDVQCAMGGNGMDKLLFLADRMGKQHVEIELAAERVRNAGLQIAALDIVQLLMALNLGYRRSPIIFSDIHFQSMLFDEEIPDLSKVSFSECTFNNMYLAPGIDSSRLPRLHGCLIGSLDGVATLGDLPPDAFHNCDVIEFSNAIGRNAEILATDLPLGTKVLLTVLNKLFNQAGRGRRENAFVRGLDARARALVPEILGLVQSHGFAFPCRIRNQTIWLPRREKGQRVADIMARPSSRC